MEEKLNFAKKVLIALNRIVIDEWFPYDTENVDMKKLDTIQKGKKTQIVDVRSIADKMAKDENVPDEYVEYFYGKMLEHRYARMGVWFYGYKISYDPETKAIYAEDMHEADVKVINYRNRPLAYVQLYGQTSFYKVSAENLDGFLYRNHIAAEAVRFDPESISTFYAYQGESSRKYFIRQTPAIINARKNSYSADFWRLDINKSTHENDWGIVLAVWEDHLVEDCGGIYVSDGMDKDDYEIAVAGYAQNSYAAKEVARIFRASSDDIDSAVQESQKIKGHFQDVVDSHKNEIYSYMLTCMGIDPEYGKDKIESLLNKMEQGYGFDCGWLYFIFANNADMEEMMKNASLSNESHGIYGDGSFSLNLPYATQSTTMQRYQANMAAKFIEEECGEKLRYYTKLD